MYKKSITYTDYNGVERTEDAYFNLNETEITVMEMSVRGGMKEQLERIVKAQDTPEIIKIFQDLIRRSYGVKSPDGRRFIKTPELFEEFSQTEAYNKLFMELATDTDAATEFVNAIVPQQ